MVIIETINDNCEQWKLFYPVPNVKYCRLAMGLKVFWPCKYVLMNDEEVVTVRDQCHVIVDGVNNLSKKWGSCKDDSLVESFKAENMHDVANMVEDLHNEELHGEMIYISEDGVEGSVGESGFDSMSEEKNEENIVEGDEKVSSEENFEWNNDDFN